MGGGKGKRNKKSGNQKSNNTVSLTTPQKEQTHLTGEVASLLKTALTGKDEVTVPTVRNVKDAQTLQERYKKQKKSEHQNEITCQDLERKNKMHAAISGEASGNRRNEEYWDSTDTVDIQGTATATENWDDTMDQESNVTEFDKNCTISGTDKADRTVKHFKKPELPAKHILSSTKHGKKDEPDKGRMSPDTPRRNKNKRETCYPNRNRSSSKTRTHSRDRCDFRDSSGSREQPSRRNWNVNNSKNDYYSKNYNRSSKHDSDEYVKFTRFLDSFKGETYFRIEEMTKDLFEMGSEYSLAHCVAEDMSMGSGIAVVFSKMFKKHGELLNQRQKSGGLAILESPEGRYIYYLVTKKHSTGKPTLISLFSSLQRMQKHTKENDVTKLAMPRIGCGLDRLEWRDVKPMIEYVFKDTEVEIIICNINPNFEKTNEKLAQKDDPSKKKKQTKIDNYITKQKKHLKKK